MDRSCEERMMGWEGREEKVRGGQGERGGERRREEEGSWSLLRGESVRSEEV